MKLGQKVALFIAVWLCVYTLGFLYYRSLTQDSADVAEADAPLATFLNTAKTVNKETCIFPASIAQVGIVVVYRNVPITGQEAGKMRLLRLVRSIVAGGSLGNIKSVVVVDDHSSASVSQWIEWTEFNSVLTVRVVPNSMRRGSSSAKAAGAMAVLAEVDVLVFLEPGSHVTNGWLQPLLHTLDKHPHAVAYPGVDSFHSDDASSVTPSGNVVGAFDWGLRFRWEDLDAAESVERLRFNGSAFGYYDEVPSPAFPDAAFAIRSHFYSEIGGMPLSKSFVAYAFPAAGSPLAGGTISQGDVDVTVMSIAELWLGKDFSEYVFQSRFSNRVPYKVTKDPNARRPAHVVAASMIGEHTCATFEWFLTIYPGLLLECDQVKQAFADSTNAASIAKLLHRDVEQYSAPRKAQHFSSEDEIRRLAKLAAAEQVQVQPNKKNVDRHEAQARHEDEVKHLLLCEDFPDYDCEGKASRGECHSNVVGMIFTCPKSCKLCDTEGQFCSDLYLGKCPFWKTEGKCEDDPDFVDENCRYTCRRCTRADDPKSKPILISKPAPEMAIGERVDPEKLHAAFLAGKMPDRVEKPCALKGTPNGQMMDAFRVATDPTVDSTAVRIFCGIYTMEQNHGGNVKATIDTWGKRCDGFVAFSTKDDLSLNAIRIEHDGEESYNNMWQKSRSIWKYIGQHFSEQFDFFVLGGDDMYFIVENLRRYLGSPAVQSELKKQKGLYIGRRFFPPNQPVFNSGGAGAVLDRVALHALVTHVDNPPCRPHQVGFWEDVNVAFCLAETSQILPMDTRDSLGRERFHPFSPGQHLSYRIPPNPDWYAKYNPELKVGFDCCSEESISFHYVKEDLMPKLHGYMYHCPEKPKVPKRPQNRS